MKMPLDHTFLLAFFLCSFSNGLQAQFRERRSPQKPASEITVTLKIDWNVSVVNKEIPASYVTNVPNGTVLVDILNKAAGDDKQGPFNKYNSIYYGGIGYYITAMNGTQQNSTTGNYWFLFDEETGGALPCGVSSYVPINQSTTIFRYTTYSSHNDTVSGFCKDFPSSGQVANGTVLVDIMNKAADENTNGPYNRWTSTYFGGLGHFITSMNGTEQDPATDTYWMIYDKATGKPTPLGVDSYKPQDESTTIFRLVTGASHEEATTGSSTVREPNSSPGRLVGVGLITMYLLAGIEALVFL